MSTARTAAWTPEAAPASPAGFQVIPGLRHHRRPRVRYAAVAVAAILAVIVAQLSISLLVTRSAYTLNTLQNRQTHLTRQYQVATEALAKAGAPQNLAARAHGLGMVSGSSLAYLRLSDGAILGTPEAAKEVAPGSAAATTLVPDALVPGLDGRSGTAAQPSQAEAGGPGRSR